MLRERPEIHEAIARANRAYREVVGHMIERSTLPEGRGVEWRDPDAGARVLFACEAFRHPCEGATRVRDVTGDRDVTLEDGAFATEPMHVYLLTGGH